MIGGSSAFLAHLLASSGKQLTCTGASCFSSLRRFATRKQLTSHLCMRLPNGHASDGPSRYDRTKPASASKQADDAKPQDDKHSFKQEIKQEPGQGQGREREAGKRPVRPPAPRGPASDDEASASSSDDEEFGFDTHKRSHTLASFVAYAEWAKKLHFSGHSAGDLRPPADSRATSASPTGSAKRLKLEPSDGTGATTSSAAGRAGSFTNGSGPFVAAGRAGGHGHGAGAGPSVAEIEAEFWRVVERPETGYLVETQYGQDLDSGRQVVRCSQ